MHHNPYMTDSQRVAGYYGAPSQFNHHPQHDNSLEAGGRLSQPSHHRSFGQDLINPGPHCDSTGKPATSGQPNRVVGLDLTVATKHDKTLARWDGTLSTRANRSQYQVE